MSLYSRYFVTLLCVVLSCSLGQLSFVTFLYVSCSFINYGVSLLVYYLVLRGNLLPRPIPDFASICRLQIIYDLY